MVFEVKLLLHIQLESFTCSTFKLLKIQHPAVRQKWKTFRFQPIHSPDRLCKDQDYEKVNILNPAGLSLHQNKHFWHNVLQTGGPKVERSDENHLILPDEPSRGFGNGVLSLFPS